MASHKLNQIKGLIVALCVAAGLAGASAEDAFVQVSPSGAGTVVLQNQLSAPFANPRELFDRIKRDLGVGIAPGVRPAALPSDEALKKHLDELSVEYRRSTDAARKEELKKALKDAELDREARRFLTEGSDYAARRSAFCSNMLDAVLAISVVNQTANLKSAFRCSSDQTRKEFLDILRELPGKEVAAAAWARADEQLRLSGNAANGRVAQIDADRAKRKDRLAAVRLRLNERPAEAERAALESEAITLQQQLERLEFDRAVAMAALNSRNARFIEQAEDLVAAAGPLALDTLIPVLYGNQPASKSHAAALIRRTGLQAVPRLLEACERTPNDEIFAILGAFAGKNFGRELRPWREWWAGVRERVEGANPGAAESAPADRAPESPGAGNARTGAPEDEKAEDWMKKLKDQLKDLRLASEKLHAARQQHADAMLQSNELEKRLADTSGKAAGAEAETADLRKALADALRREYAAKLGVDEALAALEKLRKVANAPMP